MLPGPPSTKLLSLHWIRYLQRFPGLMDRTGIMTVYAGSLGPVSSKRTISRSHSCIYGQGGTCPNAQLRATKRASIKRVAMARTHAAGPVFLTVPGVD